jgi:hypothetical protein
MVVGGIYGLTLFFFSNTPAAIAGGTRADSDAYGQGGEWTRSRPSLGGDELAIDRA